MTKEKAEKAVLTDEQIIELFWLREEQAIKETDYKYGKYLFKIAYGIVHDRCDSEECQNDTYLGVWNTIPPNRPIVLPAFLTQITKRIAISRYNEKNCKKRIPCELTLDIEELNELLYDGMTIESEFETLEIGRYIRAYVKELPDRQQYIFVSKYYMEKSVRYIAQNLGVAVSTVYRHLNEIKQGLRCYLKNKGVSL